MRHLTLLSCVFLLALTSGCGYTTGSVISDKYKTIYVAPFENKIDYMNATDRKIYIPQMETKVHDAVVDRFLFDGNLHVTKEGESDLVLKGQLLSFERDDLRIDPNNDVKEYRLTITVALTLWDTAAQKAVWTETGFAGGTTYFVSGPLAKSESTAIQDALTDLSRRVVARTIEDW